MSSLELQYFVHMDSSISDSDLTFEHPKTAVSLQSKSKIELDTKSSLWVDLCEQHINR